MLGIASTELAIVYILCILAGLWCLVYGIFFWKSSSAGVGTQDVVDWEKEERELKK